MEHEEAQIRQSVFRDNILYILSVFKIFEYVFWDVDYIKSAVT